MKLLHTTITGADENTDVGDLIRLAEEFKWIEFGILISEKKAGSPRYPTKEWIIEAAKQFIDHGVQPTFSYHLCGAISRDFVAGVIDFAKWDKFMPPLEFATRMQINVNIGRTEWKPKETALLMRSIHHMYNDGEYNPIRYIVQFNSANHMMWYDLVKFHAFPHILYDASGGHGRRAPGFGSPIAGMFTGYSGGYNPDNIEGILEELQPIVGAGVIWVDVETGVRTEDNRLDTSKAWNFCDKCRPYYIW